jgi:hypothetical protein
VTGSGLKPDNNWHHLAAVWNRGAVLLFLDGKKAGTQAFPNAAQLARSKLPLVIGHASGKDANTVFFEGFISDVAVWNSARDASAISQNASQRLTGTEAGLVVWYALREEKPAAAVSGLPRGVPDGQLTGALARTGWYETPSWDDPKPDRPWIHFFRYDLSGAAKPVEGQAEQPRVINGSRRLVANDRAEQPGVLWRDPGSKQVYVTWVERNFSDLRLAALPTFEKTDMVAGTWGAAGSLYYLMIEPLPGNHPETQPPKAVIRHASSTGQLLHETKLDTAALSYYAGWGRGNMAFANDTVSLLMPRILCNGNPTGEGVHHQASLAINFPADLSAVQPSGNPSSHSFGTMLSSTSSSNTMGLELGDCFPRALQLHKFTKSGRTSKIIFNYKANLITIDQETNPIKVSHDANTYTELGGVAEGEVSYSVIIATDRSPAGLVLDYSRVGIEGDPRDIALLRVAKDFEKVPGGYDVNDALMVQGVPYPSALETGEFHVFTRQLCRQRNPGVVWLTNYGQGEAAHAPHIIRRRDGNILIVWEKTGGADGGSLWAMVVQESGRKIVEPVRLGVDMELDREDSVIRVGTRNCMLARDRRTNKLTLLCFIDEAGAVPQPWAGRNGWGTENPEFQKERQRVITAALRKQLDVLNAIADKTDRWESMTAFLAGEQLGIADPALAKEARDGVAELLKDPAIRKEQDAAQRYLMIADLERKSGRSKNKRSEVAAAYRDLATYFKDTRAGRKAGADFERLNKDLGLPPLAVVPTAQPATAPPPGTATPPAPKQTAPGLPPVAPRLAVSPAALEQWQARLVKKLDALAKSGAELRLYQGGRPNGEVRGANDTTLTVRIQGNDLPMPWKQLSLKDRAALAKEAVKDDDVESMLIAAVFQVADGNAGAAEDLFGKAAIKDAGAVKNAKATLAPP